MSSIYENFIMFWRQYTKLSSSLNYGLSDILTSSIRSLKRIVFRLSVVFCGSARKQVLNINPVTRK